MRAIISDIHSNWEALQVVLHDIAVHRVSEIYCLGDLVGYGPDPRRCLDAIIGLELSLVVRGNHDHAVLHEATDFSPPARRALDWTRECLLGKDQRPEDVKRRRNFLESLPETFQEDHRFFVHGSPRDPLHEYVFPQDAANRAKMAVLFWMTPRFAFMGHTHVPGVFTEEGAFLPPLEGKGYRLGPTKALCNVGSVGQPRDGDPRACYVLLEDDDTVHFRRLPYARDLTCRKVQRAKVLDDRWYR